MRTIKIIQRAGAFAEDKDMAAAIRDIEIRPALVRREKVRLDFKGVDGATQSFIHALISDVIRTDGAAVLDRIAFKSCNANVRSVIEIVAEYSQLQV